MKSDSFIAGLARRVVPEKLLLALRRSFLSWQVTSGKAQRENVMAGLPSLVQAGDVVADLGANIGIYAMELSRLVGPQGRVFSVEPLLENFRILAKVVRSKRLSNVHLQRAAVGARPGRQEMVIPKAVGFFGGFYTAHLVRGGDEGLIEVVEMVRLDDLHNGHGTARFDFVRADVPGAELQAIEGGASVLASRPGVLLGVSRRNGADIFKAMKSLGYRAFLYTNRFEEILQRSDSRAYLYFFLHPESRCWQMAQNAGLLSTAELASAS